MEAERKLLRKKIEDGRSQFSIIGRQVTNLEEGKFRIMEGNSDKSRKVPKFSHGTNAQLYAHYKYNFIFAVEDFSFGTVIKLPLQLRKKLVEIAYFSFHTSRRDL